MNRWLVIFLILSLPSVEIDAQDLGLQASEPAEPMTQFDSIRSRYIESFPDHFFIWPVFKQKKLDFELRDVHDRKNGMAFKSNKPYSAGVGLYLFELGVEILIAVPLNEKNKSIYGKSKALDAQLNLYGKRWGADLFYQKYKGFYEDDFTIDQPANTPYPQRQDIRSRNVGVTGYYVQNNKKFSFRSAYNFAERQKKSAGTFIALGSLTAFKTTGDTALLGRQYRPRFGDDALNREIKVVTLGVAPGYSYNFIYKAFFLNGTLAVGPSYNWITYSRHEGETRSTGRIDAFLSARISVGFNADRYFGGFVFVNQARTAQFEEVALNSSNGYFKFLIGMRFLEKGILKKRIWELPKSLF